MAAMIAASPVAMVQSLPSLSLKARSMRRSARVVVRASAEEKPPSSVEATPTPVPTPAPVAPKAPGFGDVMAFSGPAPETINGRLAMLGFTTALGVEVANHSSLASQLGDSSSLSWFALTVALFSAASLVPMLKFVVQGVSTDSKSSGFWSSQAEMWNGRAAMLGLVFMAITEYVKGASLV